MFQPEQPRKSPGLKLKADISAENQLHLFTPPEESIVPYGERYPLHSKI